MYSFADVVNDISNLWTHSAQSLGCAQQILLLYFLFFISPMHISEVFRLQGGADDEAKFGSAWRFTEPDSQSLSLLPICLSVTVANSTLCSGQQGRTSLRFYSHVCVMREFVCVSHVYKFLPCTRNSNIRTLACAHRSCWIDGRPSPLLSQSLVGSLC